MILKESETGIINYKQYFKYSTFFSPSLLVYSKNKIITHHS